MVVNCVVVSGGGCGCGVQVVVAMEVVIGVVMGGELVLLHEGWRFLGVVGIGGGKIFLLHH